MVALQAAFAVALCIGKVEVTIVDADDKMPVISAVVRVVTRTMADPAAAVVSVGKPVLTNSSGIADLGDLTGLKVIRVIVQSGALTGTAEIRDTGTGFPPMTLIEVRKKLIVPLPPPK